MVRSESCVVKIRGVPSEVLARRADPTPVKLQRQLGVDMRTAARIMLPFVEKRVSGGARSIRVGVVFVLFDQDSALKPCVDRCWLMHHHQVATGRQEDRDHFSFSRTT